MKQGQAFFIIILAITLLAIIVAPIILKEASPKLEPSANLEEVTTVAERTTDLLLGEPIDGKKIGFLSNSKLRLGLVNKTTQLTYPQLKQQLAVGDKEVVISIKDSEGNPLTMTGFPDYKNFIGFTGYPSSIENGGNYISILRLIDAWGANVVKKDTLVQVEGISASGPFIMEVIVFDYTIEAQFDDDQDTLPSKYELDKGLDPNDPNGINGADGDCDSDGLTNYEEYIQNTHACEVDTDKDCVNDNVEVNTDFTSPLDRLDFRASLDANSNGLPDACYEIPNFGAPLGAGEENNDDDGDGLTNAQEYTYGTDPNNADSDYDLLNDGGEIFFSLNPIVVDYSGNVGESSCEDASIGAHVSDTGGWEGPPDGDLCQKTCEKGESCTAPNGCSGDCTNDCCQCVDDTSQCCLLRGDDCETDQDCGYIGSGATCEGCICVPPPPECHDLAIQNPVDPNSPNNLFCCDPNVPNDCASVSNSLTCVPHTGCEDFGNQNGASGCGVCTKDIGGGSFLDILVFLINLFFFNAAPPGSTMTTGFVVLPDPDFGYDSLQFTGPRATIAATVDGSPVPLTTTNAELLLIIRNRNPGTDTTVSIEYDPGTGLTTSGLVDIGDAEPDFLSTTDWQVVRLPLNDPTGLDITESDVTFHDVVLESLVTENYVDLIGIIEQP